MKPEPLTAAKIREIDKATWKLVGADDLCPTCGQAVYTHTEIPLVPTKISVIRQAHRLCDGSIAVTILGLLHDPRPKENP